MTLFHPALHPVFETLAYVVAGAVYRALRRSRGDVIETEQRWTIVAAAAVGAVVSARVLGLLEQVPRTGFHREMLWTPGGKTIVGALLGGWAAVELAKWLLRIRSRTGDLFALPLCVGIAIGRIGCFFAGFADDTYGKPTSLPWGIDLGDGVPRHPVQLYEIGFLILIGTWLWRQRNHQGQHGYLFRVFLAAYLAWRFAVDFLKPQPLIHGLNAIQWACLEGMLALAVTWKPHSRHSRQA